MFQIRRTLPDGTPAGFDAFLYTTVEAARVRVSRIDERQTRRGRVRYVQIIEPAPKSAIPAYCDACLCAPCECWC